MDRTEAAVSLIAPESRGFTVPAAAGEAAGSRQENQTLSRQENQALDAVLHDAFARMAVLAEGSPERMRLRADVIELALPLASRLARRFRGRGEQQEDLTQTAALALVKAVDSYDPGRCVPFIGYLVPCVVGALKRHFRDKGWDVRVPRLLQERHLAIEHATEELTQRLRRAPTADDLAVALGMSTDEVVAGLAARQAYDTTSLNEPTGGNPGGDTLQDLLGGPDADLEEMADRLSLGPLLRRLPARERTIVTRRFFGNQTQLQIATDLGISQMHVSRILSQALGWLRRALLDDNATAYPRAEVGQRLAVRVYTAGRTLLVTVAGAVDAGCAPALRTALVKAVVAHRPQRLIVDLHDVPTMTTEGAAALVAAHSACGHVGARLRLVRLGAPVAHVLDRTGVARMLGGALPRSVHATTPPRGGELRPATPRRAAPTGTSVAQPATRAGGRAAARSHRPVLKPWVPHSMPGSSPGGRPAGRAPSRYAPNGYPRRADAVAKPLGRRSAGASGFCAPRDPSGAGPPLRPAPGLLRHDHVARRVRCGAITSRGSASGSAISPLVG